MLHDLTYLHGPEFITITKANREDIVAQLGH